MYEEDLALNKLEWLICHKTKLNQINPLFYLLLLDGIRLGIFRSFRKRTMKNFHGRRK